MLFPILSEFYERVSLGLKTLRVKSQDGPDVRFLLSKDSCLLGVIIYKHFDAIRQIMKGSSTWGIHSIASVWIFLCLLVVDRLGLIVPLENFSLIWRCHHYRWWPLSSEGFLACNTFCDTGHPFIMVILEDPWHAHLLPSAWKWMFVLLQEKGYVKTLWKSIFCNI